MISPHGYGRYTDDPAHVGCPRAHSSETPCIARDGALALDDAGACVGCGAAPRQLLTTLRNAVEGYTGAPVMKRELAADDLARLVREATEPGQ